MYVNNAYLMLHICMYVHVNKCTFIIFIQILFAVFHFFKRLNYF